MKKQNVYYIIACSVIILAFFYLKGHREGTRIPPSQPITNLPLEFKGFVGTAIISSDEKFHNITADEWIFRVYTGGDDRLIGVFIGYWGYQNEKKKINPPRYTDNQWDYYWIRTKPLNLGSTSVFLKEFLNERGREKELVYYCYIINKKIISNEYYFRFLNVVNLLVHGKNNAALLRVSMPVTDEWPIEKAETYEENFMREILPLLIKYI